jgi:hypothetical protein
VFNALRRSLIHDDRHSSPPTEDPSASRSQLSCTLSWSARGLAFLPNPLAISFFMPAHHQYPVQSQAIYDYQYDARTAHLTSWASQPTTGYSLPDQFNSLSQFCEAHRRRSWCCCA